VTASIATFARNERLGGAHAGKIVDSKIVDRMRAG